MDGTFPPGVVADGCQKKCQKNEIIVVNPAKNEWNCVPKSVRDDSKESRNENKHNPSFKLHFTPFF
jgi:hypothetical protein